MECHINVTFPVCLVVIDLKRVTQAVALFLHAEAQDRGIATHRGGAGATFKIIGHDNAIPRWLGDMDVAVDPAGHDIKPGGIDDVGTVGQVIGQVVGECRNFTTDDANVGNEGVACGDNGAVFDNAVKLHVIPLCRLGPTRQAGRMYR